MRLARRGLLPVGIVALITAAAGGSGADTRHKLREIRDDSVDLVMSVSWDYDAPAAVGGNRTYLQNGLRHFAERTFQMTQGRLRVCKVFVYKETEADEADIVLNPVGRANARLGALRELSRGAGQICMFSKIGTHAYSEASFGTVLAHEFGHYGLYLRDEYRESTDGGAPRPSALPRACDVTLDTMMGAQTTMHLSMAADYEAMDFEPWQLGDDAGAASKEQKYRTCEALTPPGADAKATEDAKFRTAQWRTYKMSGWETITGAVHREVLERAPLRREGVQYFASILEGGMPDVLSEPAWDDQCFKAVFMEGHFVVLVIDKSQSMTQKTGIGTETFMDRAKKAAKNFVAGAPGGTTISIVTFDAQAATELQPTMISKESPQSTRDQINTVIDGINATSGDTGFDSGLLEATKLAVANAQVGNYQYVVAISDGEVLVSDWIPQQLYGAHMPVFTNAVGFPSQEGPLAKAARLSSGQHRLNSAWTFEHVQEVLDTLQQRAVRTWGDQTSNTPVEEPLEISELDGSTAFRAYWSADDTVGFELVAPDGSVITPSTVPAGMTYEQTTVSAVYRVAQPKVGSWKARLVPQSIPTGPMHVDIASHSPLALRVDVRGGESYPEPWFVYARVETPKPVVGALVKAALVPEGSTSAVDIAFADDGVAPDEVADDGIYTAVIADVTADGKYELEVSATNPGGARIDSIAIPIEEGEPEPPVPISGFARRSSHAVESKGYRDMPQSPEAALQVRNDLTPIWVTINQPGDVVWLKFNGYKKGHYVAMTGNLIANDDGPMTTKLTLYDTDGKTVLRESAGSDGRALIELRTPDVDGVYYLKAEHTGMGVGRFRVAVAPAEWFEDERAKGTKDDDPGVCGCRMPGSSAGRTLALSALFAAGGFAYLVRRRRRRS